MTTAPTNAAEFCALTADWPAFDIPCISWPWGELWSEPIDTLDHIAAGTRCVTISGNVTQDTKWKRRVATARDIADRTGCSVCLNRSPYGPSFGGAVMDEGPNMQAEVLNDNAKHTGFVQAYGQGAVYVWIDQEWLHQDFGNKLPSDPAYQGSWQSCLKRKNDLSYRFAKYLHAPQNTLVFQHTRCNYLTSRGRPAGYYTQEDEHDDCYSQAWYVRSAQAAITTWTATLQRTINDGVGQFVPVFTLSGYQSGDKLHLDFPAVESWLLGQYLRQLWHRGEKQPDAPKIPCMGFWPRLGDPAGGTHQWKHLAAHWGAWAGTLTEDEARAWG